MRPRVLVFVLLAFLGLACSEQDEIGITSVPGTEPASIIAGVVRDTEGTPLEDVVVTLQRVENGRAAGVQTRIESRDPALPHKLTGLRSTVTDGAGSFVFSGVTPGDYALESSAENHLAASLRISKAAADTSYVDIDLVPTGTFAGVVLRENATTHLGSIVYVEGSSYFATTDSSGSYQITGVPVGQRTIRAEYWGYLEDSTNGELTAAGETVVLPQMLLALRSNIQPNATISVSAGPHFQLGPVTFTPQATDPDGSVVFYEWDFDGDSAFDTSNSTGQAVQHAFGYGTEGLRVIKLRVTDDVGDVGVVVTTVTVEPNQPPTVALSGPAVVPIGEVVTFVAAASDTENDIAQYEFDTDDDGTYDFNAGATNSVQVPAAVLGPLTVVVRVTDGGGLQGTGQWTVSVEGAAVYVSTAGSPSGAGTKNDPLSSIGDALTLAQGNGASSVLVAGGTYTEAVTLRAGINIVGGLNPAQNWQPSGGSSVVKPSTAARHTASGITVATQISRVWFEAHELQVGNSIALHVSNCSSALQFLGCDFRARNAAWGASGGDGVDGQNGLPGQDGQPGSCDGGEGAGGLGGGSFGGCVGGNGGRGGLENGDPNGAAGSHGSCASGGSNSGDGGAGGFGANPGTAGYDGFPGSPGSGGFGGSSASPAGTLVGTEWTPLVSATGQAGSVGEGGGGGGGGGAQDDPFANDGGGNGGGGGGGAGTGGSGGAGGQGGHGAFCVFLYASNPVFSNCRFTLGGGGRGGDGGDGGLGGSGGPGGLGALACPTQIGSGGDGANGGRGGDGAGGGGGPGGPSIGVYLAAGSVANLPGASFVLGATASGGTGGNYLQGGSAGDFGTLGIRASVYP